MQRYGQPGGYAGPGGNPYGAPQSRPPAPAGDSAGKVVAIILAVVFGVMLLLGVIGYFTWKAFMKFGMGSDVDEYAEAVRASQLDPTVEAELIERLDRLEDGIRSGELHYSLFEWIPLDEEVAELTGDNDVDPAEVPALIEALEAMEEAGR